MASEPHENSKLTMNSLGKKPAQCHPGECREWSDSLAKAMIGSPGQARQSTKMLHIQDVVREDRPIREKLVFSCGEEEGHSSRAARSRLCCGP